ncbi:MAG: hypothetical protein QM762_25010 [Chryseolinea sp.]
MDHNTAALLIRRLSIFLLIAIPVYVVCLLISGLIVPPRLNKNLLYRRQPGHSLTRFAEAKETKNVDILFIGSSHCYRGFDPRIFAEAGYRTFNLGSGSQTPSQSELLIDRYLDQLNPKIVIYEVYGMTFCIDGIESTIDLISNDKNDWSSVKLALRQRNLKVANTLIYSELMNIFHLAKTSEPLTRYGDTYITGGYVSSNEKARPASHAKETWIIKNDKIESFERILDKLRKRNIKILLVQAPIAYGRFSQISNRADFDKVMERYGYYVNFNNIMHLNDTVDFYDSHHLNQSGVNQFNREIMQYLKYAN